MKKRLLLFVLFLLSSTCFATDTTFYENGKIMNIYKRHKFNKRYDENGTLRAYNKYDTFFFRGKMINYDSLGNISSTGRTIFGTRKQGRWKEYNNGKKHIVNYKYGVEKSKRRTPQGKKIKLILIYGLGSWGDNICDSSVEKYHVQYVAVAGCVVNQNIVIKTGIHNFFIYLQQRIRFGRDWENEMYTLCGEKNRF
jgi:hypothetical protein